MREEGPFSTEFGLIEVQERDLGWGELFGWERDVATGTWSHHPWRNLKDM